MLVNTALNNLTTLGTNVSKTVTGNTFTLEATSINIFGSFNSIICYLNS